MSDVNIKQVEGGETTTLSDDDGFEVDTGTTSLWIKALNLAKAVFLRINSLTEDTSPQLGDFFPEYDNSATTFKKAALSSMLAFLPDGTMLNGKFTVSISANDLIVALKTQAGNDPSAADPVLVKINGTWRTVTAATSITLADATNWFNAGSAELATKEIDYFVYVVWDSNSAVVAISIARIPYGRIVSDFSNTTTNEKYLGNYANFTATDDVVVIGRLAATLSAGAAYTWTSTSQSAPTNSNTIQHPIFTTRLLSYSPTWASTGTQPAIGDGTLVGRYRFYKEECLTRVQLTAGASTTFGTGTYTFSSPFTSATFTNGSYNGVARIFDSSTTTNYTGVSAIISAGNTITAQTDGVAGNIGATAPITLAASDQIRLQIEFALN